MDINKQPLNFNLMEKHFSTANVSSKEALGSGTKLLSLSASTSSVRSEVLNDEIVYEGTVKFCGIIKENDEIKSIERIERFSASDKIAGITPSSKALSCGRADKVRGYIEAGNLMMTAQINISSIIVNEINTEIISDIQDENMRVKSDEITVNKLIFHSPIRFNFSETTALSPRVPEVAEILCVKASASVDEAQISAGQLILGGTALIQTAYRSVDEYEPIVQVTDKLEFSQIIDINSTADGISPITKLAVDDITLDVSSDEQGEMRLLTYNLSLSGYSFACEKEKFNIITDAYSIKEKLNCICQQISASYVDEPKKITVNKNVQADLPDSKTPIARISSISFLPEVCSCKAENSKLIISCTGEVSAVYTASGTGEAEGFNTSVSFEIVCDDYAFESVSDAYVQLELIDIQATLVSGKQVELRCGFLITALPQAKQIFSAVSSVEKDEKASYPEFGIIIYNTKKGDSIWEISKRYGVDPDEIKKLNPELDEDIKDDQKIYIFRKLVV